MIAILVAITVMVAVVDIYRIWRHCVVTRIGAQVFIQHFPDR